MIYYKFYYNKIIEKVKYIIINDIIENSWDRTNDLSVAIYA